MDERKMSVKEQKFWVWRDILKGLNKFSLEIGLGPLTFTDQQMSCRHHWVPGGSNKKGIVCRICNVDIPEIIVKAFYPLEMKQGNSLAIPACPICREYPLIVMTPGDEYRVSVSCQSDKCAMSLQAFNEPLWQEIAATIHMREEAAEYLGVLSEFLRNPTNC